MQIGPVDVSNLYGVYGIETFNTDRKNPNTLCNNSIRSLAEDSKKRIWTGTDNGLFFYDQTLEKIFQINIPGIENELLSKGGLLADEQNLQTGNSNGLFRMNTNSTDISKVETKIKTGDEGVIQ